MISYKDELQHHGIKGQKWGVRRYQNKDGSLTSAGKKRYGRRVQKAIKKDPDKFQELVNMRGELNRQRAAFDSFERNLYGQDAQKVLDRWGRSDLKFKDIQRVDLGGEVIERAKSEYDASEKGKKDNRVAQYDKLASLLYNGELIFSSSAKSFLREHHMDDRWWSNDSRALMSEIANRSKYTGDKTPEEILNMTPSELIAYAKKNAGG